MKRLISIIAALSMLFTFLPMGALAVDNLSEGADKTVKFTINEKSYLAGEKQVKTDVAPYIKSLSSGGGRTMVPVAYVAPALGTEAPIWQPDSRTVTIKKGAKEIKITIGSMELLVDGQPLQMDVAAEIKDLGNGGGRTMLPIAFIARALEIGYEWDDATRSVKFYGYNKVYDKKGTFGPDQGTQTIEGNVVIKADGVILQNMIIKGNLEVAKEVGSGTVTLNNITVKGDTFVRGGGKDSIKINGGQYASITVESVDNQVRIVATDVNGLQVVISEKAKGEDIILEGKFENVVIKAPEVKISTQGQTTIKEVTLATQSNGTTVTLGSDTVVDKMVLESKADIKGSGTIQNAEIKAEGITFEKAPVQQTVAPNVQTQPVTTTTTTTSGGGGGGGSSTVAVSAIAITGNTTVGQTLTATPTPSGATVSYQWMRCDTASGAYVNIAGATSNTYVLTNNDAGKYIKVTVTGTGSYTGTQTSAATAAIVASTTTVEILGKASVGLPTSEVKVKVDSSYVNAFEFYFDGGLLASTSNGSLVVATAVLNDLTRVQVKINGSLLSDSNSLLGTW